MQGAAEGGTPMQATPCGLSKQGNVADFPEKSLIKPKIWETQENLAAKAKLLQSLLE